MTTEPGKDLGAWELESGLISDVDAWMANCKFGFKEEYRSKVLATGAEESGMMFLVDLIAENGEILASQGWSVGTGWVASDDGSEITHPKRTNVVRGCRYADLQERVVKELGIDMMSRGLPTKASVWEGLGFHWMLEDHTTVGGDKKQGIMPTIALAARPAGAPAPQTAATGAGAAAQAPAAPVDTTEVDALLAGLIASSVDAKAFQIAAMKIPAVTGNDAVMASIFDEGPEGYFQTHKK